MKKLLVAVTAALGLAAASVPASAGSVSFSAYVNAPVYGSYGYYTPGYAYSVPSYSYVAPAPVISYGYSYGKPYPYYGHHRAHRKAKRAARRAYRRALRPHGNYHW